MKRIKNPLFFFHVNMGGKRLVFPKRKKFVAENKANGSEEKHEETPEQREAKMQVLRDMGLIK